MEEEAENGRSGGPGFSIGWRGSADWEMEVGEVRDELEDQTVGDGGNRSSAAFRVRWRWRGR
jgi:hypothetical protein